MKEDEAKKFGEWVGEILLAGTAVVILTLMAWLIVFLVTGMAEMMRSL